MTILSSAVSAILLKEAEEILLRLMKAAEPEVKILVRQFEERLAHLAERVGQKAFDELKDKVQAQLQPPAAVAAATPATPAS